MDRWSGQAEECEGNRHLHRSHVVLNGFKRCFKTALCHIRCTYRISFPPLAAQVKYPRKGLQQRLARHAFRLSLRS